MVKMITPLSCVLLFLAWGAKGGEPPPESECRREGPRAMREMLSRIAPLYDVVRAYGPPSFRPGFQPDGSFQTGSGILIDGSCFKGVAAPAERTRRAQAFEDTSLRMLGAVQRCGRKRLLPAVEGVLYHTLQRRPRFDCDPKGCVDGDTPPDFVSEACDNGETQGVTLVTMRSHTDEDTWFHELLHWSGADNQDEWDHELYNDPGRDEVYYWEEHCFHPGRILTRIRDAYEADRSDPAKVRKCIELMGAGESVAGASGPPRPPRSRYNARERAIACDLYRDQIVAERRYGETVDRVLVPQVFNCNETLEQRPCVDVAALNARLKPKLPPAFLLPDRDGFRRWIAGHCPAYVSRKPQLLKGCLGQFRATFSSARRSVSSEDGAQVDGYLERLIEKAEFVSSISDVGAERAGGLFQAAEKNDENRVAALVAACEGDRPLAKSPLCRAFRTTLQAPMLTVYRRLNDLLY